MISEEQILQVAQAIERDADGKAVRASYNRALGFDAGRLVGRQEAAGKAHNMLSLRIADLEDKLAFAKQRIDAEYLHGVAVGDSEGYERGLDSAQHAAYEQGKEDARLSYEQGVADGRHAEESESLRLARQEAAEEYQRGLDAGRAEKEGARLALYRRGYDNGRKMGFRLCKRRINVALAESPLAALIEGISED